MNIWDTILLLVSKASGTIAMKASVRFVQKAPDEIRWEIDRYEFDELLASKKKESAPGPDGRPYSFYRCAGGLGSQFLYKTYKHVIECGSVPALFAASRTVPIPKSSDADNNGRIVRSPEKHYVSLSLCAIVIARFSPRRFAEAFNGTP